jgi:metal-sulfur cluster biosynthetic enzyme
MRPTPVTVRNTGAASGSPQQTVWQVLGTIIDPEVGIPITELGLVYSVEVADGRARVVMTTTTPVCPLGAFMQREIERGLAGLDEIESVEVEIVHTPRWCPDMITESGRHLLGW